MPPPPPPTVFLGLTLCIQGSGPSLMIQPSTQIPFVYFILPWHLSAAARWPWPPGAGSVAPAPPWLTPAGPPAPPAVCPSPPGTESRSLERSL